MSTTTEVNYNPSQEQLCPSCSYTYMLSTKKGTPLSTFKDYIKTLSDGGTGDQFPFPSLPWQTYVMETTLSEANEIAKQPFIEYIMPVTHYEFPGHGDTGVFAGYVKGEARCSAHNAQSEGKAAAETETEEAEVGGSAQAVEEHVPLARL